jgi:hypothetical protein
LVQGTVCKILGQEDIKPHKVRYYLERRDAEFEQRMAEVLGSEKAAPTDVAPIIRANKDGAEPPSAAAVAPIAGTPIVRPTKLRKKELATAPTSTSPAAAPAARAGRAGRSPLAGA